MRPWDPEEELPHTGDDQWEAMKGARGPKHRACLLREVSGRRPQLKQEQPDGRAAFGEDARDSDGSVGVGIEKQVHGHQVRGRTERRLYANRGWWWGWGVTDVGALH